jgi:hypothetical protein
MKLTCPEQPMSSISKSSSRPRSSTPLGTKPRKAQPRKTQARTAQPKLKTKGPQKAQGAKPFEVRSGFVPGEHKGGSKGSLTNDAARKLADLHAGKSEYSSGGGPDIKSHPREVRTGPQSNLGTEAKLTLASLGGSSDFSSSRVPGFPPEDPAKGGSKSIGVGEDEPAPLPPPLLKPESNFA